MCILINLKTHFRVREIMPLLLRSSKHNRNGIIAILNHQLVLSVEIGHHIDGYVEFSVGR